MNPRRRRRISDSATADDPLALVPNLFDVSIVLAVAFLLAALSIGKQRQQGVASGMEAGLAAAGKKLEKAEIDRRTSGRGVKLGTAYRLESGEVIYVAE